MKINYFSIDNSQLISYSVFVSILNNNNLIELNSFKMRNLFSLIFNNQMRDYVVDDIFRENGSLLNNDTKNELFRNLSIFERDELKNYLLTYLNYQIESKWLSTVYDFLNDKNKYIIIISNLVLNDSFLMKHLMKHFPKKKFKDWVGYDGLCDALILDYNHAWKKRNLFTIENTNSTGYFLSHYFKNVYDWKVYNDQKHLFNRLNSPTRISIFTPIIIDEIKSKLTSLKPTEKIDDWLIFREHENSHNNSFNPQEEIILHFSSTKRNKYSINSNFLVTKDTSFFIKNSRELLLQPSSFIGVYQISNLENIISKIDLGKVNQAISKDNTIAEAVKPLWAKFDLSDSDGQLWKQLLKRNSDKFGYQLVFSEIETLTGISNFVTYNTFKSIYCNPLSETIVPGKIKIFKSICQYLGLPLEYRVALQRERNLVGGHSQEKNSKLKSLVIALVELKIFDKSDNDDDLLDVLNSSVDILIEKVDMDFFGFTKEALIYASIELCYEIKEFIH